MDALSDFFECFPGLAFIADESGTFRHVSHGLTRRLGDRAAPGVQIASMVVPEDLELINGFLRELAETEDPVSCTIRVAEADGSATLRCVARRSPNGGAIHGQIEPLATDESADPTRSRIESALFRTVIDTLDIVVWAIDTTGQFVFHDGKALPTAGLQPGQFLGLNMFDLYPPELVGPIRTALAGTPSSYTSEAHGIHWKTWNIPLRNAEGHVDHCVGLTLDISPEVQTERELTQQIQTIRAQQRAIHELAAPVLRVWDNVLAVPLIGTMDSQRISEITERLLDEAYRAHARFAILDLTGVELLDTAMANDVLRLLGSLRLLGVEGIISGISPAVGMTMVGIGIDLGSIRSYRSLREALRYCMQNR
jgi:rsbT co-antagonist protein RsbR